MTGLRVVLAEDDVLLREGMASLLDRSGFEIIGQAGDSAELLRLVREKTPALVVVDIRMPPTHTAEGLDAARQIRKEHPQTGILSSRPTSKSSTPWSSGQRPRYRLPPQEPRH